MHWWAKPLILLIQTLAIMTIGGQALERTDTTEKVLSALKESATNADQTQSLQSIDHYLDADYSDDIDENKRSQWNDLQGNEFFLKNYPIL